MSQQPPVALEARKITKRFAGVVALRDVDLRLYAGKVNAIVGENGAGKSTLMNILSGVYADYEGELLVGGGAPRHFASTTEACRAGIAMIHQELNLVGGLSVAENIFLGREPLTALGLIDYPRMRREAAEVLRRLRFAESPDARVGALRVGQQQLVEIAKALARNARILIMDEPTSSLAEGEVAVLFDVIRALTARGVAIGYITHKMGELAQLADYVTVLRDGCLVHAAPARELSADELVRLMVGRDPADFFARGDHPAGPRVLEAEGITLRDPARPGRRLLDGVSLHAAAGEVLGLYGLMGAGRTELLETLFGLHPAEATGALRLGGSPARLGSPAQAIAHGVALVPEDRKGDGLVLGMSIAQNTTLAALGAALRGGLISPRRERGVADEWRARLGIKSHSARQPAASLSGGNQQKVVLAKWLLTRPRLLLLDEPTRGVDIGAKREIYRLIGELAAGGMAIVVASSELPELMAIADRIAVLCGGRLTGELAREAFSEEALLKAALPDEGRQVANAAAKQAALQMPLNGEAPQRATVLHAGGLPSSAPSKEGMRDPNPIDRDS